MEEKRKVGRPTGIKKNKTMFGYKYNEEEYNTMSKALEKFKVEHNCTTSKALYDLIVNSIK